MVVLVQSLKCKRQFVNLGFYLKGDKTQLMRLSLSPLHLLGFLRNPDFVKYEYTKI